MNIGWQWLNIGGFFFSLSLTVKSASKNENDDRLKKERREKERREGNFQQREYSCSCKISVIVVRREIQTNRIRLFFRMKGKRNTVKKFVLNFDSLSSEQSSSSVGDLFMQTRSEKSRSIRNRRSDRSQSMRRTRSLIEGEKKKKKKEKKRLHLQCRVYILP